MHPYNILGTQTGRLSTLDRNREFASLYSKYSNGKSYMDMRDLRPKGASISPLSDFVPAARTAARNLNKMYGEIRGALLNIDYCKLEQRALALSHTEARAREMAHGLFAFAQTLVPYTTDPTPSQPRDIYVIGKPIELNPSETFRVEFTLPPLSANLEAKIQDLLTPKCSCETRILMRAGCQCGGV